MNPAETATGLPSPSRDTPTYQQRLKPRERDAIIQSLRSGVVPKVGHQHIQVGRSSEVKALLEDIERVADGGSSVRFVIGEYGSGKTFFLNLIRAIALEKKLVVVTADLSPDRRLHATGDQARSLYSELMRNIATRATPEGGAMTNIVERFVTGAQTEARDQGVETITIIRKRLDALSELVGGYDFAEVVAAYWRGYNEDDADLKNAAVRWLRGEYTTKTDARAALGVRSIVNDASFYDHLKIMALFVQLAGFGGMIVLLDEMVNLYKLSNTQARTSNYEQVLRIVNDSLQGSARGLGWVMGGTPDFLADPRKGLYSYAALQSRLEENHFAVDGLVDYSGPVLRLSNLTQEDFYVLLTKLRHVYADGDPEQYLIGDDAIQSFMAHCNSRIGDNYFRTPRTTIKQFVDLLAVLDQNPNVSWSDLVAAVTFPAEVNPDLVSLDVDSEESDFPEERPEGATRTPSPAGGDDDELTVFRL